VHHQPVVITQLILVLSVQARPAEDLPSEQWVACDLCDKWRKLDVVRLLLDAIPNPNSRNDQ
jgi:hypothetical protein